MPETTPDTTPHRPQTAQTITRRRLAARSLQAAALLAIPALAVSTQAQAKTLASPTERVILTVSGLIRNFNVDNTAQFDRPMLEALGMKRFQTRAPWFDQPVRFEGPPITRLLDAVGAYGDRATVLALNDYATEIPLSDFARFGTILAMKRDGEYLNVRDKGPLFVVYPYDSDPELRQQKYYGRSAWQVERFVIK